MNLYFGDRAKGTAFNRSRIANEGQNHGRIDLQIIVPMKEMRQKLPLMLGREFTTTIWNDARCDGLVEGQSGVQTASASKVHDCIFALHPHEDGKGDGAVERNLFRQIDTIFGRALQLCHGLGNRWWGKDGGQEGWGKKVLVVC